MPLGITYFKTFSNCSPLCRRHRFKLNSVFSLWRFSVIWYQDLLTWYVIQFCLFFYVHRLVKKGLGGRKQKHERKRRHCPLYCFVLSFVSGWGGRRVGGGGGGWECWWWDQGTSCLVGSYVLFTGKCNFPLGLFLPFCLNLKQFWSDFDGETRLFSAEKSKKFDYCSWWYGLDCAFVFSSVSALRLWVRSLNHVTFIRSHVFILSSSHKVTLK